jgi:hypothetical protein
MSERIIQASRQYTFEVEMEITNALDLSPGELSAYLLDALFEMDFEGTLFPGLTLPGEGSRVLSGCVSPIGYRRGVDQGTYGEARRKSSGEAGPETDSTTRTPEEIALYKQLEPLWLPLLHLFKEQRLFQAKLFGLLDVFRSADPLTDEHRQTANQYLQACEALFSHHAKTVEPLL